MNAIDLHCHTIASDGLLSPAEVVAYAAKLGMETIAITDHDTVDGIAEALAAAAHWNIEVIPGVEINTDVPEGEVHILGFFFHDGWQDVELGALLRRIEAGRIVRARKMVQKLVELGVPISFQRVQEIAGRDIIGRMHVALALVEAGHVATRREAFTRYIDRHGPAYADRFKLSPADACRAIARAGGLPVLAHPLVGMTDGVAAIANLEARLMVLCEAGLVGLEVYYPGHTAVMMDQLLALARRFDLIPSGGSDYHGPMPEKVDLGSVYVPRRCLRRLREAAHAYCVSSSPDSPKKPNHSSTSCDDSGGSSRSRRVAGT
jgi:predicted metal-dependent phosphoesterase TrpH